MLAVIERNKDTPERELILKMVSASGQTEEMK